MLQCATVVADFGGANFAGELNAAFLCLQFKPDQTPITFSPHLLSAPAPTALSKASGHLALARASKMHRQLSLSASPKQQQQPPDGTGDAAQAMALAEDESSASHSHSKASRGARDERAIHLIPLLTFLCFLLLFLCSHDPSAAGTYVPLLRYVMVSMCGPFVILPSVVVF